MPPVRQERNRRNRFHRVRQEYLHLAISSYSIELARERRARAQAQQVNRDNRQPNHELDSPRINVILTPQSIIVTVSEPHVQRLLVHRIVVIVWGCVLIKLIRTFGIYLMHSEALYTAAEIAFVGRIFLLLVCDLFRMWCLHLETLRYRLETSACLLVIGLWIWFLAKWNGVPMF